MGSDGGDVGRETEAMRRGGDGDGDAERAGLGLGRGLGFGGGGGGGGGWRWIANASGTVGGLGVVTMCKSRPATPACAITDAANAQERMPLVGVITGQNGCYVLPGFATGSAAIVVSMKIIAFLAVFGFAGSALAADGAWWLSGDFSLSIEHYTQSEGDNSITLISVKPSLDYVMSSHISVGGQFILEHGEVSGTSGGGTAYGFFGRVGYLALLGGNAGLWVHGGLGWEHGAPELGPLLAAIDSGSPPNYVVLNLTAQFLYFPVQHFFIGAGPVFNTQLFTDEEGSSKLTSFGLESIVGGYF